MTNTPSAEESQPEDRVVEAPETASPGAMLRAAREATGRSIEELAEAAKLSVATVAALEADDFVQLKEPVYVRGYYRKCALILDIDAEALTRAYDAKARPPAPALPSQVPIVSGGGSGILRRLLRYLVILLLLALFGVAAFFLFESAPVLEQPARPAPATERSDAAAVPADPPAEPAREAPPPAAQSTPPASPQPSAAQGSAEPLLRIDVSSETWLRIRTNDGRTLINDLVPAGQSQRFREAPPLDVFLGYAPGAEITWRGQPVNLAGRTRSNNTARVTLE